MEAGAPVQLATLIVTGGAVAFALSAAVWAHRLTAGARSARRAWRKRIADLEDRAARAESLFAAHPGLVMVWETPPQADGSSWTPPALHGSPAALAALFAFAELDERPGGDPGARILEGLADFEARSASGETTTLRQRLNALVEDGKPFSLTLTGPSGRFIEADGRPAGRQLVVWLTDATIKGLEEAGARGRVEVGAPDRGR